MAKLSDNQAAAVTALKQALSDNDATVIDKNAWKKATPEGVSVNTASLVKAGAIAVTMAQVGSRTIELYAPVRPTAEIGG